MVSKRWPPRARATIAAFALLYAPSAGHAQRPLASTPWLWGDLRPGPYAVGFRVRYANDRSRTWTDTRPYGGAFTPDTVGRPIRISLWYPATSAGRAMRLEDYVHDPEPGRFAAFAAQLEARDRAILLNGLNSAQHDSMLAGRTAASRDAPAEPGRFPLVLYLGGLNMLSTENVAMAEYLASHGYVVAAIPMIGPGARELNQSVTATDLEASVRDAEVAWAALERDPHVDARNMAVLGYSLGGTLALEFALRNGNVGAVVTWDGQYGFADAPGYRTILASFGWAPRRMRAALLDLHRSDAELGDRVVDALTHADRTLVRLPRMRHGFFSNWSTIAHRFTRDEPADEHGFTFTTGYQGYMLANRITLDFLDAHLRNQSEGMQRLTDDVSRSTGSPPQFVAAIPAPPTAAELLAIVERDGYEAGQALVARFRSQSPGDTIVREGLFNAAGYQLMADRRIASAIDVLQLVTYAYPESQNAEDSLGDAYLAAGRRDAARAAYQRSADLAATDPSIAPQNRASVRTAELAKVNALAP